MATDVPKLDHGLNIPTIRQVSVTQPFVWLKSGWRDFLEHPAPSMFYGALVVLCGVFIFYVGLKKPFFVLTATSAYPLLAPLLAAGIYELTRQREMGRTHPTLGDSLKGLFDDAGSVINYGVILSVCVLVWERVATTMFALAYSGEIPSLDTFMSKILFSQDFMLVAVAWVVVGGILASVVFAITMVGIPMVVDRKVDAITAMVTSVRAVRKNVGAMSVWAGIIVVMSLIGWATLMLGLLVIMPVLGHATWCAYRDLVQK